MKLVWENFDDSFHHNHFIFFIKNILMDNPVSYTHLLIATQSDHIILDKAVRADFYAAIQNKIECFGGRIELVDTIDLELARKP